MDRLVRFECDAGRGWRVNCKLARIIYNHANISRKARLLTGRAAAQAGASARYAHAPQLSRDTA